LNASSTKVSLRTRLRAARAALSTIDQTRAGERLAARVVGTRWFRVSRRIACYLAADGEIDPAFVIERIWAMHKRCYLPVLSRLLADSLWFAPMEPGVQFAENRFGIPEPVVPARQRVRAQRLDLVLLPLVGFDVHGNRLGMGAGFYDRSLAFLRHRRCWQKPYLLGLAHDFQRVDRLPPDPWDIRLDAVVTDTTVYPSRVDEAVPADWIPSGALAE
jgi:5-formyltetrahydrofolate cyclo-ligase